MKSRDRRVERMSEFVTNMFQYNVTVGIARSEVLIIIDPLLLLLLLFLLLLFLFFPHLSGFAH